MSYESNYDWGTARRSTYRVDTESAKLRWWIVVAVLLSIIAHVFLIYWFGLLKIPEGFQDPGESRVTTERYNISPELLREKVVLQDVPLPSKITPSDFTTFKPELDEFEIQELLPEEKITFTPATDKIVNLRSDPAPAFQVGDDPNALDILEAPASEDLTAELAKLKEEVLSLPSSEHQKLLDFADLELGDSGPEIGDLEDFIDEKTRGMLDGAKVKGFSSIDDLLGKGGIVTAATDPILMPTDLLFEFGKYELAENARLSIMKLGILIQRNADAIFIIEGHTDTIGTDESNQRLSIARAQTVKNWLVERLRLDPNRIKIRGAGESRPIIAPSGDRVAQSLNRRVEITVEPR